MKNNKSTAKDMEYIGIELDYRLFRNNEGFIEGYKTIYKTINKPPYFIAELLRVVTNTKERSEFKNFVTRTGKSKKPYNPYKDEKQTKLDIL
jgi:hypothetical protein